MASLLHCRLDLPAHFSWSRLVRFHGRDTEKLAECTTPDRVEKGLLWSGQPALLRLERHGQRVTASLDIATAPVETLSESLFRAWLDHLLGLNQPVQSFEARAQHDPLMGGLVSDQRGLRVPQTATPFEALSWAIIGQQISVAAAVAIRRRLIRQCDVRHSSGRYCYPDAATVLNQGETALRQAGLSRSKAQALLAVSQAQLGNSPPLPALALQAPNSAEAAAITDSLLAIKGVGPWTVNYTLLRGLAVMNGGLAGNVAVRRGIQQLSEARQAPSQTVAAAWLQQYAPYQALVAAHLWAMQEKSED